MKELENMLDVVGCQGETAVVNGGEMKCDCDEGDLFDGSDGYVTPQFTVGGLRCLI